MDKRKALKLLSLTHRHRHAGHLRRGLRRHPDARSRPRRRAPTAAPTKAPAAPTTAPAAPTAAPTKPAAATTPAAAPTVAPAKTTYPEPKKPDQAVLDFWKGKTVNLIVPHGAGGGYDTYARLIAPLIEKQLGCTIVVVNDTGAGGEIGRNKVYNSKGDGLTLGFSSGSAMVFSQASGSEGVQYDITKIKWMARALAEPSVWWRLPRASTPPPIRSSSQPPSSASRSLALAMMTSSRWASWPPRSRSSSTPSPATRAPKRPAWPSSPTKWTSSRPALAPCCPLITSGDVKPLWVYSNNRMTQIPNVPTVLEATKDVAGAADLLAVPHQHGEPQPRLLRSPGPAAGQVRRPGMGALQGHQRSRHERQGRRGGSSVRLRPGHRGHQVHGCGGKQGQRDQAHPDRRPQGCSVVLRVSSNRSYTAWGSGGCGTTGTPGADRTAELRLILKSALPADATTDPEPELAGHVLIHSHPSCQSPVVRVSALPRARCPERWQNGCGEQTMIVLSNEDDRGPGHGSGVHPGVG